MKRLLSLALALMVFTTGCSLPGQGKEDETSQPFPEIESRVEDTGNLPPPTPEEDPTAGTSNPPEQSQSESPTGLGDLYSDLFGVSSEQPQALVGDLVIDAKVSRDLTGTCTASVTYPSDYTGEVITPEEIANLFGVKDVPANNVSDTFDAKTKERTVRISFDFSQTNPITLIGKGIISAMGSGNADPVGVTKNDIGLIYQMCIYAGDPLPTNPKFNDVMFNLYPNGVAYDSNADRTVSDGTAVLTWNLSKQSFLTDGLWFSLYADAASLANGPKPNTGYGNSAPESVDVDASFIFDAVFDEEYKGEVTLTARYPKGYEGTRVTSLLELVGLYDFQVPDATINNVTDPTTGTQVVSVTIPSMDEAATHLLMRGIISVMNSPNAKLTDETADTKGILNGMSIAVSANDVSSTVNFQQVLLNIQLPPSGFVSSNAQHAENNKLSWDLVSLDFKHTGLWYRVFKDSASQNASTPPVVSIPDIQSIISPEVAPKKERSAVESGLELNLTFDENFNGTLTLTACYPSTYTGTKLTPEMLHLGISKEEMANKFDSNETDETTGLNVVRAGFRFDTDIPAEQFKNAYSFLCNYTGDFNISVLKPAIILEMTAPATNVNQPDYDYVNIVINHPQAIPYNSNATTITDGSMSWECNSVGFKANGFHIAFYGNDSYKQTMNPDEPQQTSPSAITAEIPDDIDPSKSSLELSLTFDQKMTGEIKFIATYPKGYTGKVTTPETLTSILTSTVDVPVVESDDTDPVSGLRVMVGGYRFGGGIPLKAIISALAQVFGDQGFSPTTLSLPPQYLAIFMSDTKKDVAASFEQCRFTINCPEGTHILSSADKQTPMQHVWDFKAGGYKVNGINFAVCDSENSLSTFKDSTYYWGV